MDTIVLDQVYLISIERSRELRRLFIEQTEQIIRTFFPAGPKILGVDGHALSPTDIKQLQSRGVLNKNENYREFPSFKRELSMSEIGCFLSHFMVWEDAVEHGHRLSLIFEDDSLLPETGLEEHLKWVLQYAPPEFDFISLHHFPLEKQRALIATLTPHNDALLRVHESLFGTNAYLLSQSGAQRFVEHLVPLNAPIDTSIMRFTSFPTNQSGYVVKEPVITTAPTPSITEGRDGN